MDIGLHVKYRFFVSDFNVNLEFSQISNFMKIRRVGTELFRENGQIYMTKLCAILRAHLKRDFK
jgi:hypothetical protein